MNIPIGRGYTLSIWRCVKRKSKAGFIRSLRVTLRVGEERKLFKVIKRGVNYG